MTIRLPEAFIVTFQVRRLELQAAERSMTYSVQMPPASSTDKWRLALGVAVALALLNASLTFDNVWPTPKIRWANAVSIELAVVVLLLAIAHRWAGSAGATSAAGSLGRARGGTLSRRHGTGTVRS